jgi:hypothetical protein
MDGLLSDSARVTAADCRPATRELQHLVPFVAMSSLSPKNNRRKDDRGLSSIWEWHDSWGQWGDEITGFVMKETIRAFVFGILILLAALIPPAILLMHYFGR